MRMQSIHPRVFFGSGIKKNTCKPRSKAKIERAIAGIERHLGSHPGDQMSAARLAKLKGMR